MGKVMIEEYDVVIRDYASKRLGTVYYVFPFRDVCVVNWHSPRLQEIVKLEELKHG
jgi:hypothetical protein